MSEKIQHTTALMRVQMNNRYNDGLEHKHNKNHHSYRQHCRSHPPKNQIMNEEESVLNSYTGIVNEFKLRKTRKRQGNGNYH